MQAHRQKTLWTLTANPAPALESASIPTTADVVIIGAGFTGLTAAREIAKSGKTVVVLEASYIGAGATGVNAGFVVPNFAKADPATVYQKLPRNKADALLRLVGEGADAVFSTIREEQISCDANQVGWLQPAYGTATADLLRKRTADWQALGRPVRFLSPQEVEQQTSLSIYSGGLLDESGGTIHPLNYAMGLARAVKRHGGVIREGAEVRDVRQTSGGWTVIFTGGVIQAGAVLLCTNAFTTGAAGRLGRTTVPLRVYQVATRPLPRETVERISPNRRPVGDTRSNLFTYRLDRDNRLISGGMAVIPVGAFKRIGKAVVDRLVSELRLEQHPGVEIVWTGVAAMTPDFLPRLHEFGPGFFGGIGCNGRGIAMTAQLGRVLARAALGEPLETLPVPTVKARPLPFHAFTPIVASAALAHARFKDWMMK
ncbi:FAD-dependent oxidoreductase (plasmid) [Neorhizobium sp. SOG26]|uniref:NAD(P)/FAD-dependent oxidoreductase n=1 Tax=Neorhizobium sp. SOG26 TaxID=2060726 RepID=UPI000E597364|nr:FAD-dependent oxidoreductase [Neorhizobium sp. SOG26]AXV17927.1 FAD-dependent oxidoreductase [Neorhizobium sp. SOG26]